MTLLPLLRRHVRSLGWSATYLLVSRISSLIAVPIILERAGTDLYAAWVLGGALVMSQGLIDLGVGASVTRFVSMAAAEGSRAGVLTAMVRGASFYGLLSLAVGAVIVASASAIAGSLPALSSSPDVDQAKTLFRYAALTFLLTNATMVAGSVLQGLGRVDASFKAQAIGWSFYVPALSAAFMLTSAGAALGVAWVATYGVQLLLLGLAVSRAFSAIPQRSRHRPGIGEMLGLGVRWQVSSWADFASFQFPRIIAGAFLPAGGVVAVDVAMRFAQAVVTPVFAALPIVLPRATDVWVRDGLEGLRSRLSVVVPPVNETILLGAGLAAPLAWAGIATWTGRSQEFDIALLDALVVVGFAAHSSTGLLSSSLLAIPEVGLVVRYKSLQLLATSILVPVGALIGPLALGTGLSVGLAGPALYFNIRTRRRLGLPALAGAGAWRFAALLACGSTLISVAVTSADLAPWIALAAGAIVGSSLLVNRSLRLHAASGVSA